MSALPSSSAGEPSIWGKAHEYQERRLHCPVSLAARGPTWSSSDQWSGNGSVTCGFSEMPLKAFLPSFPERMGRDGLSSDRCLGLWGGNQMLRWQNRGQKGSLTPWCTVNMMNVFYIRGGKKQTLTLLRSLLFQVLCHISLNLTGTDIVSSSIPGPRNEGSQMRILLWGSVICHRNTIQDG